MDSEENVLIGNWTHLIYLTYLTVGNLGQHVHIFISLNRKWFRMAESNLQHIMYILVFSVHIS